MANLYAPDGVLLATASPKLRQGREDIHNYFEFFLTLEPVGTITEAQVQLLSDTLVSARRDSAQFNNLVLQS